MKLKVFATLALALLPTLSAAAPLIITGSGTGRTTRIPLVSSSPKTIYVAFPSLRKDTQTLRFDIEAPGGAKVSINSSMVKPKSAKDLGTKKLFPAMLYNLSGQGNKVISLGTAAPTPPPGSGSSGYVCGCLTEANVQDIIRAMSRGGFAYTREMVCQEFGFIPTGSCGNGGGGIGNGSSTSGNKASLAAFIQRDACSPKSHTAVMKIDLSKAGSLAGKEIVIKAKYESFEGNRRTKVKAQGEGRFKGSLLLSGPVGGVSYVGSLGDPHATRWSGTRKVSDQPLEVADFVFYPPAGGMLWRIPLPGALLTGARGTFELRSSEAGHSVCAVFAARDQFFNGYSN